MSCIMTKPPLTLVRTDKHTLDTEQSHSVLDFFTPGSTLFIMVFGLRCVPTSFDNALYFC